MRSTLAPLSATGAGQWFPLDTIQSGFGVGYLVSVQDSSTLTYKIQHGFYDESRDRYACRITRSTTTATLTWNDGTLMTPKTGDSLVITGAGVPLDGVYDVASVTSSNVVTYTVANSGNTVSNAGAMAMIIRTEDDPIVVSKTATTSGNIAFPANAIRLNLTAYTTGAAAMTVNQGIFGGVV